MTASAPALSRRRELGATSARSLLTTVLGEYVLPRDAPVWTTTLILALGLLGVEEKAARQAVSRTAAEGWITVSRHGRRARWSLTGPGRELLSEGARRIYSFGRDEPSWDGTWLIVIISVPEAKRELRHRLRTRLSWAGFGSPAPGVWICPDVSREGEARQILADLALDAGSMSFRASYGLIGDPDALARQAWDLDGVNRRYQEFLARFGPLRPDTAADTLVAQTLLVHEWRRFPFLDPRLPADLLPAGWSGTTAAQLFHARHAQWRPAAQQHWDHLLNAPT